MPKIVYVIEQFNSYDDNSSVIAVYATEEAAKAFVGASSNYEITPFEVQE